MKMTAMELFKALTSAAEAHGVESEPDHEVGDLQSLLRAAMDRMSSSQLVSFCKDTAVLELLSQWGDGPEQCPFRLMDEEDGGDLTGFVELGPDVKISLEKHSNDAFDREAGAQPIVVLELYEGKPRLVVHGDYHDEAPTHTIDLSGAKVPREE